jgi:hypothetical protein
MEGINKTNNNTQMKYMCVYYIYLKWSFTCGCQLKCHRGFIGTPGVLEIHGVVRQHAITAPSHTKVNDTQK